MNALGPDLADRIYEEEFQKLSTETDPELWRIFTDFRKFCRGSTGSSQGI